MRIFLDECVDRRLARDITDHEVNTARQMEWRAIKNGELLSLVAKEFDVFLTVDRNLAFQQNVLTLPVAVVVLHAKSTRLADLKSLVPELLVALGSLKPRSLTIVGPGA